MDLSDRVLKLYASQADSTKGPPLSTQSLNFGYDVGTVNPSTRYITPSGIVKGGPLVDFKFQQSGRLDAKGIGGVDLSLSTVDVETLQEYVGNVAFAKLSPEEEESTPYLSTFTAAQCSVQYMLHLQQKAHISATMKEASVNSLTDELHILNEERAKGRHQIHLLRTEAAIKMKSVEVLELLLKQPTEPIPKSKVREVFSCTRCPKQFASLDFLTLHMNRKGHHPRQGKENVDRKSPTDESENRGAGERRKEVRKPPGSESNANHESVSSIDAELQRKIQQEIDVEKERVRTLEKSLSLTVTESAALAVKSQEQLQNQLDLLESRLRREFTVREEEMKRFEAEKERRQQEAAQAELKGVADRFMILQSSLLEEMRNHQSSIESKAKVSAASHGIVSASSRFGESLLDDDDGFDGGGGNSGHNMAKISEKIASLEHEVSTLRAKNVRMFSDVATARASVKVAVPVKHIQGAVTIFNICQGAERASVYRASMKWASHVQSVKVQEAVSSPPPLTVHPISSDGSLEGGGGSKGPALGNVVETMTADETVKGTFQPSYDWQDVPRGFDSSLWNDVEYLSESGRVRIKEEWTFTADLGQPVNRKVKVVVNRNETLQSVIGKVSKSCSMLDLSAFAFLDPDNKAAVIDNTKTVEGSNLYYLPASCLVITKSNETESPDLMPEPSVSPDGGSIGVGGGGPSRSVPLSAMIASTIESDTEDMNSTTRSMMSTMKSATMQRASMASAFSMTLEYTAGDTDDEVVPVSPVSIIPTGTGGNSSVNSADILDLSSDMSPLAGERTPLGDRSPMVSGDDGETLEAIIRAKANARKNQLLQRENGSNVADNSLLEMVKNSVDPFSPISSTLSSPTDSVTAPGQVPKEVGKLLKNLENQSAKLESFGASGEWDMESVGSPSSPV